MVDHIRFPKGVGPLLPTEKIKKVERRKDKQQDAAFKEQLEKENTSEDQDAQDSYVPSRPDRKPAAAGGSEPSDQQQDPGEDGEGKRRKIQESEKRIDVHA